jgi:hypothetical protein
MRYRVLDLLLPLAAVLTLTSCSQFHESYLFRSGRPGKANYYRVTISGTTTFTSSQFAAGLYDAEAVDALFGELKGPGKRVSIDSAFAPSPDPNNPASDPAPASQGLTLVAMSDSEAKTKPMQTLDGKTVKDQKFVFFLSSNANAFINAIQTYVDSQRIQTAMVSLMIKDDVQKLEAARASERIATARTNALKTSFDASVAPLGNGDGATSEKVRAAALKVLALLASRSGAPPSPPKFDDFEKAEAWLRDRPGTFRTAKAGAQ